MDILNIYILLFISVCASLPISLLIICVFSKLQRSVFPEIRHRLLYTLLVKRYNGSQDYTYLSILCIALYLATNTVFLLVNLPSNLPLNESIIERSGAVFIFNLVPLYIGTSSRVILELGFGLCLRQSLLVHKWIGRVCIINGIIHILSSLAIIKWKFAPMQISVCPSLL